MKVLNQILKSRTAGVVLLIVVMLSMPAANAYAGWGTKIAEKVAALVEYLEDKDETIASIMVDQLSKSSKTRSYTRYLYKDNVYTAIAVGDSRIKDTDLVVYRKSGGSWVEVKRDADSSNAAMVNFKCNTSGEYKFEVKAYSFESDYSNAYYGFILSF